MIRGSLLHSAKLLFRRQVCAEMAANSAEILARGIQRIPVAALAGLLFSTALPVLDDEPPNDQTNWAAGI